MKLELTIKETEDLIKEALENKFKYAFRDHTITRWHWIDHTNTPNLVVEIEGEVDTSDPDDE